MTFSATLFGTKCPACGAPVPTPAPGTAGSCPYCHASLQMHASLPHGPPAAAPPGAPARRFGFVGVITALTVLPAVVGIVASVGAVIPALHHASFGTVKVGNLASAPLEGWTPVDAPGMVGSFESFDAIANLGWAHGMATAWKRDAALFRIDTDRVASNGTVDIVNTPDGSVEYRFTSPACVAAYKGSTAVADPQSKCELDVKIELRDGKPVVRALASSMMAADTERPIKDPACSLAKSFAALRSANALLERPVYNAAIYDFAFPGEAAESPRWTFSTVIHGQGDIPNVDATSCVVAGHEPPTAAGHPASLPNASESKPAALAAGLADEPVEISWTGRITAATGAAPRPGASCVLSALVVPSGTAVESKRTTLVCAGKTLYDSSVEFSGMANAFFTLEEKRAPGEAPAFSYQLGAEDVGARTGRSQLMVFTPKNKLDAFSQAGSPFHVHVQIATSSAVRAGKPLLAESLKAAPPAAAAPVKSAAVAAPAHRQVARVGRR